MNEQILFYLSETKPLNKTFDEVYQEKFRELMKYHFEYGKDGFLSERTHLDSIDKMAEREANLELKNSKCGYTMKKVFVCDDTINTIKNETEKQEDFVRWLVEE